MDFDENLPDVSEYELVRDTRKAISEGKSNKCRKKDLMLVEEYSYMSDEELDERIGEGHDLAFVGRVGQFCPIKPGTNGGTLYRVSDGTKYAATGSKGYRWLESEQVKMMGREGDIDTSFYKKLIDAAITDIYEYGDLDWFIGNEPVPKPGNTDCLLGTVIHPF